VTEIEREHSEAVQERESALEKLRRAKALRPVIEARTRRMEALKRDNGFAESIHRALAGNP
jgi:hypothetical protein